MEADRKPPSANEWLIDVPHYVNPSRVFKLNLLPENRVVKQVEVCGVELAVQLDRLPGVEDIELASGKHGERPHCNKQTQKDHRYIVGQSGY